MDSALRPQSLWFGPPERPLLGFYHPPSARLSGARACAVVLCYPFGHEYTAVYQVYRQLAERLSAEGFPVLRFDYDGTGDSAGDDEDPGRLRAWLESVGAAIRLVQAQSGAQEVCLFGLRFGAMLAYLAAREHPSVTSLILWAPNLTGKAFLRELRAMRLLKDQAQQPAAHALALGDEEAGGFLLSKETLRDVSQVSLLSGPPARVQRVLLLAKDTLRAEEKLANHLTASGVATDYHFIPGYATLVVEPYNVVTPEDVFSEISRWLSAAYTLLPSVQGAPVASPQSSTTRIETPTGAIREHTVRFGTDGVLFGILSERDRSAQDSHREDDARPAVLFLNTSVIHRVGANRMVVPMARSLTTCGFPVLRIDLSSLGDSRVPGRHARQRMYEKDCVRDVRAAMDLLSTRNGISRFVLIGLCSGAYMAFHTGLEDPRVVAQVMINPQTFEWREGDSLDVNRKLEYKSFRFYLRAALREQTWSRLLHGQVNWKGIISALATRGFKRARTSLQQLVNQRLRENKILANFRTLLSRKIQMLLIYSQEDPGLDELTLHVGPDAERLRSYPNFRFELIDGPDHTFTPVWSQRRLEEIITAYLVELTEKLLD